MIRSDAGRCPISAQRRILGVAKSTCHWMLEHPEAERADPYEKDVERVWRDSGKVYGARKIKHALEHEGVTLSRRRINRIMKRNGMASSYSKAAYRPRPDRPNDDPAPDILAREFNGHAPRTHLASDPAYARVGSSWAYVCLPGDLANRQIAGHSVGVGHDADRMAGRVRRAALPAG
ncbi:IS3 family transposase [Bifidobacterium longum]|uniref:IS3 family transposase n=1 Tax=Bifidobacterium longum TaxID=216816 RepID=UPI000B052B1F|nr:IS3 family transposase [Bifidobacterium longum]